MKEPGGRTLDDEGDDDDGDEYDDDDGYDDDNGGVYDDDDGYDDNNNGEYDDDDNEEAKHDNKNSLLSCHLPRRPGRLRVPRCKRNGRGRNETCQPEDTCFNCLII